MSLFKRRCHLEKLMNRSLGKDKCLYCVYYVNGKCRYKQIAREEERLALRGFAALTKRTMLGLEERNKADKGLARRAEWAALQMSGLDQSEQTQYLRISKAYEDEFDSADHKGRQEVKWRIRCWEAFMEDGLTPTEAYQRASDLDYDDYVTSEE